jgi:hypothetical protein
MMKKFFGIGKKLTRNSSIKIKNHTIQNNPNDIRNIDTKIKFELKPNNVFDLFEIEEYDDR